MKIRVFLISTGLGYIRRGYESTTEALYWRLKNETDWDIHLYGGRSIESRHIKGVLNLPRMSLAARCIDRLLKPHHREKGFISEQISFSLGILPKILSLNPDVIYYSEPILGKCLYWIRKFIGFRSALIFNNGAPVHPPYQYADIIQQISRVAYMEFEKSGMHSAGHVWLPYALSDEFCDTNMEPRQQASIRKALCLPQDRKIIISAGALNTHHKRMDYLIQEVSSMSAPRPFLLVLGQNTVQSDYLRKLASTTLGEGNFLFKSVEHTEMHRHYLASDCFVLASLSEGLPNVCLEAAATGIPCILHDSDIFRYAVGEFANYIDMHDKGRLAQALEKFLRDPSSSASKTRLTSDWIRNSYSWEKLKDSYVYIFQQAANKYGKSNNQKS